MSGSKQYRKWLKEIEKFLIKKYEVPVEYSSDAISAYYYEEEHITIDTKDSLEQQVYTLLHEAGHVVCRDLRNWPPRKPKKLYRYKYRVEVLYEEILAWEKGWEIAQELNLNLDYKEYDKCRVKCLFKYIQWANNPSGYEEP